MVTCHVEEDTEQPYVSIETVTLDVCGTLHQEMVEIQKDISVTITAIQERIGDENKENETNGEDTKENIEVSFASVIKFFYCKYEISVVGR